MLDQSIFKNQKGYAAYLLEQLDIYNDALHASKMLKEKTTKLIAAAEFKKEVAELCARPEYITTDLAGELLDLFERFRSKEP